MKGHEFLKKLKKLGDKNGIPIKLVQQRGKGSHSTLFYGERFTIIRNPKDELKSGTLNAMLKQLGLTKNDLR